MATRAVPARVIILLASYQGATYLPEQLESLLVQDHAEWRLVWRDDGSCDATVAILQAFADSQPPGRVERLVAPAGRLGPASAFLALLRHVAPTLAEGDLVAFADQDDVWLPFKLSRATASLAGIEPHQPALYAARQVLVDARLNRLALSARVREPRGFPACLAQNLATGCTIALNRAAARLIAGSTPPRACQHDWWCYILVSAAGGAFISDNEPVVLYRQHDRNAVGAPSTLMRRGIAAIRRGPGVFMGVMRQNVAALHAQRHLLTPQAQAQLEQIRIALVSNPLKRMQALRMPGLRRQTWPEQMLFRLWFMFG